MFFQNCLQFRNAQLVQNRANTLDFIILKPECEFFIVYLQMLIMGLSKNIKVHEKGTIRAKILPEFRGYIGPYRNGGRPKRERHGPSPTEAVVT